jgi:carbonic anhydrase/acetyltransferase-like protein (isoleucine patch superfamily)
MKLFTRAPGGYAVAHNATITGDITIGELTSFWFCSVARGDVAPISIGKRVNVQDSAVIHADTDVPNTIEDDVTIGHSAIVHGAFVGAASLIGMGAILLSRTKVGRNCIIAAGAVLAPDTEIPDRMLVMGVPGKIVRPVSEKEIEYQKWLTQHYIDQAERYLRGEVTEKK